METILTDLLIFDNSKISNKISSLACQCHICPDFDNFFFIHMHERKMISIIAIRASFITIYYVLHCLYATNLKLCQLIWPAVRDRSNDAMIRPRVWHMLYSFKDARIIYLLASAHNTWIQGTIMVQVTYDRQAAKFLLMKIFGSNGGSKPRLSVQLAEILLLYHQTAYVINGWFYCKYIR